MRFRGSSWLLAVAFVLIGAGGLLRAQQMPVPQIPHEPRGYVCYFVPEPLVVDGQLNEVAWLQAPQTDQFVDIEGFLKPDPRFMTTARLLWDSTYLYVAASLEEPHVWGTLTDRDAVIYHDNDFELFIDPDGDTHEYYELEINALNTVWDLLLIKPYRDGGPAVNAWDIQGLKTAVSIRGTLNQPGDQDVGWSVEMAIPWKVLAECAHRASPPNDRDQWKLNFSRVEWRTVVQNGIYVKVVDSAGRALPEDNWVWSPQGLIAMHYPERWGIVQFATAPVGTRLVAFTPSDEESSRACLFQLYYAEQNFFLQHHIFTTSLADLRLTSAPLAGVPWPPRLEATHDLFEAELPLAGGDMLRITQDGRIVVIAKNTK